MDAGSRFGSGRVHMAAVIRDDRGGFRCARSWVILKNCSSLFMEAEAMVHTVRWCVAENFSSLIFETDSLALLKLVEGSDAMVISLQLMVEEIKSLSESVENCHFTHVLRSGNAAAHSLAVFAGLNNLHNFVWRGNPPPCIADTLFQDALASE
ncbi:MAG: ribonuclease H family protein ['Waltheria sp.' little leaf phytoplasma]|nr:ribonuclease H family protein ['Waltheria sp.' little leaf phytoplasma]